LKTGVNFEILAGIDPIKKSAVGHLIAYIDRNKPKVVLTGPPCIGHFKWESFNKGVNYEAWLRGASSVFPWPNLAVMLH